MPIKVFISHQAGDSRIADAIAKRLKIYHSIESYLDVIDPNIRSGEDLVEYIKREMGKCNQLLAVVSEKTRLSWWVPWEIGVASEKDFPLATFLSEVSATPEYLQKWPYLQTINDVDSYAHASKTADIRIRHRDATLSEAIARSRSTAEFFRTLKSDLGQ